MPYSPHDTPTMEAFSGSYNPKQKTCDLSINNSENISKKQIEEICNQIINEEIQDLTLEFDDGNFIFFTRLSEKIRFIEGMQSDFVQLHQKAKKDLDGKIIRSKSLGNNGSLIDQTSEKLPYPITSHLDEKVLIQHSLLPSIRQFKEVFSETEIYFHPFQDPGGDFYWIKKYKEQSLVVLGDCTGHGIQGAMISMSVLTMLKELFRTSPESIQASIYEFYDHFNSLLEDEDFDAFDTELGLVLLDHKTSKVSYIGSGVNLITKSLGQTNIYATRKSKVTKMKQESFDLSLNKGDQLLLYTDGIPDQFDSMNRRKLGTRGLVEMLQKPQKITLHSFRNDFNTFKGTTEALDDQTLLILTI